MENLLVYRLEEFIADDYYPTETHHGAVDVPLVRYLSYGESAIMDMLSDFEDGQIP